MKLFKMLTSAAPSLSHISVVLKFFPKKEKRGRSGSFRPK